MAGQSYVATTLLTLSATTARPAAAASCTIWARSAGRTSVGNAINDAGQVVGDSYMAGDTAQHAFRYTGTPGSGGVMVDLGTLGGTSSHAYDINEAGFVVGVADRAAGTGGGSWATLWQIDAGNTAIDLDAWLDAINPTLGAYWKLKEARGINNNGLITGQGIYDDGPGGLSDGYRDVRPRCLQSCVRARPATSTATAPSTPPITSFGEKTGGTPAAYDVWRTHFAQTAGSGSGAYPPPNRCRPPCRSRRRGCCFAWGLLQSWSGGGSIRPGSRRHSVG